MAPLKWHAVLAVTLAAAVLTEAPLSAQYGAKNGEWRFYGGDAGSTKGRGEAPGGDVFRGLASTLGGTHRTRSVIVTLASCPVWRAAVRQVIS